MRVEVVLTESDIAQELVEAIEARDLPEKFFYWFPRSAAEWAALIGNKELYGGLQETWQRIGEDSAELAKHFGAKAPVISFGAGDGRHDRQLMAALKDRGCECVYFAVDASQAMLEMACSGAEDDDLETAGIKADISSPVHLVYAADAAEPPRLFILSGNTMGAFDPLAQVRDVAQCMKPADRLIVDGELFDEQTTMERRASAAAQKFFWTLLEGMGMERDAGEIRFNHKRDERHEGLHLIARNFRAARDVSATVAGQEIELQRGEHIGLNFQYTYTPAAFRWLLEDHGGLRILKEYPSSDGRFLTALCSRA
ncbi:MAG TPA: L-histidine N(alpha)-methyltransferase [Candidatus Limnocylindrales bacterium]|nr:L-histidine N(alpha)-methyltransferase [Candidatus Limnocylindrales bacterium]